MKREPTGRRVWIVGISALVAVCAAVYTVVRVRAVLREEATPSERRVAEARRAPERLGYLSGLRVNRQPHLYPPPAAACGPAAIDLVRDAVRTLEDDAPHPEVVARLEHALSLDPSCVAAGRVLLQVLAREALQIIERPTVARADAAPHDAAAQLMAAFYQRAVADGPAYRRYLERASAANPDQPLLHAAWANYWAVFANPRSLVDQLQELEAEVRLTGDVGSIAGLAAALEGVRDDDAALAWCRRYAAAAPESRPYALALTCARAAVRSGASEDETIWTERVEAALTSQVGPSCRHADLAHAYLNACRGTDALREADLAIAGGCGAPALAKRRAALLVLGRYGEAAEVPAARYFGTSDRGNHAIALALAGRVDAARRVLDGLSGGDDAGTAADGTERAEPGVRRLHVIGALLDDGAPRERLLAAVSCRPGADPVTRLTRAAAGYANALALAPAHDRLEQALALDPRSPAAWDVKTYLLSLEGKLDEAAREGEAALASGVLGGSFAANLGYVHQQRGDCPRAIVLYEIARERIPLGDENYTNLAKCLELLGRDEEARAAWRYVPGGSPEQRHVWPALAVIAVGAVLGYLGVKLALIKLWPGRFGRLRFP